MESVPNRLLPTRLKFSLNGKELTMAASPIRSNRFSVRNILKAGLIGFLLAALLVTAPAWVHQRGQSNVPETVSADAAIRTWWIDSRPDFIALRTALDDSQEALQQGNVEALKPACERMHDMAAVDLAAHLPTPDTRLTAELTAATNDAHNAAHICLSTIGGAMISYRAEFDTDMDQAYKHMAAAREIIDRVVSNTRYA
ncbi:hypothetical protein [Mycolicibacterium conceptionense]|uniref:hypothetical protein n=2 Tax=Mycobacteriaceae TaxID=1762 RepID=UPI0010542A80|nr:hypothetical protein [Mycolicibacterium conceptionense]